MTEYKNDTHSLQSLLKSHTHDIHLDLHEHPFLLPLLSKDITKRQYCNILKAFYVFYAFAEPAFTGIKERFDGEVQPLTLLDKDFAALGLEKPDMSVIGNFECLYCNPDYSEYIGYLYVKQGSTLGGQVISKALQKNLGLTKQQDLFYFDGYHQNTGEAWKDFLSYLDKQSIQVDKAKRSAFVAFETMQAIFTKYDEVMKNINA